MAKGPGELNSAGSGGVNYGEIAGAVWEKEVSGSPSGSAGEKLSKLKNASLIIGNTIIE